MSARKTYLILVMNAEDRILSMPRDTGWQRRHMEAWRSVKGPASIIRRMVDALGMYADSHAARYQSHLGIDRDGVLGPAWLNMLKACRVLLNGETGGLDCGTVDGLLCAMALNEGFSESDL